MENPEIKRFGRYEVLAELGRGAMGVVYKARDPQIDRLVAVKTVSLWGQAPEEENEFRLRFINEAQAAGRLHHPGIVSVFDVGESPENQDPYLVLEYVAGEALNRILSREKKLPLDRALKLTEEIAEALDYAHTQGVVHRDIKPANILITEDGHAKIADFGIAKLNLAHFTLPGKVLGTPAYMAPEQLSGEGVDGRSDLFSLGVILYVMATGHSPFQGSSATTVCFKVANREPIAASALDMSLPPALDEVIARAMAKEPEGRYQSGAELAEDLRRLQQICKPASTTTALQATTGVRASGTGKTTSLNARPVEAAAQQIPVRAVLPKARIRDLAVAAAIVVLLVIVAIQSKLFVSSPKEEPNAAAVTLSRPADTNASVTPGGASTPAVTSQPAPAVASRPQRVSKTPQPPRQAAAQLSTVDLAVQHQFKDATLYVWVDDNLALTLPLHGAAQKKLVVFNGVRGVLSQTFKVPAGKRVLRFRALSTDKTIDLSKTVSAEFVEGDTKSLQLSIDKHNTTMRVAWQ